MKTTRITAQNVEIFRNAVKLLKKLPENILSQIETAKFGGGGGLECTIRDKYETTQQIILPNKVTQISHFDDYIGVYCDKFFFKITKETYAKECDFVFIECDKF